MSLWWMWFKWNRSPGPNQTYGFVVMFAEWHQPRWTSTYSEDWLPFKKRVSYAERNTLHRKSFGKKHDLKSAVLQNMVRVDQPTILPFSTCPLRRDDSPLNRHPWRECYGGRSNPFWWLMHLLFSSIINRFPKWVLLSKSQKCLHNPFMTRVMPW